MRKALPYHDAEIEWDESGATAVNRGFNLYPANRLQSVRCVRVLQSRPYSNEPERLGTLSYVYDSAAGRVFAESFDELMTLLGVERRARCTSVV